MKIFISYRRDDSAGYAGRLFDYLAPRFGKENIFMDVDTIKPGEDFRRAIEKAVGSCDVVIVMMGRQWLSAADSQGRRRLEDPADFVRAEVASALANPKVRVIPVLVRNAGMPAANELPEDLKDLAYRNATELSDQRFQYDANRLIEVIQGKPQARISPAILSGAFVVIAVLGILFWMMRSGVIPFGSSRTPTPTLAPTMTKEATAAPATSAPTQEILSPTVAISPTATSIPISPAVQTMDQYFKYIQTAKLGNDLKPAWNLMTENFQCTQKYSCEFPKFATFWLSMLAQYKLYDCDSNKVAAELVFYTGSKTPVPSDRTYYLEYRLAEDENGQLKVASETYTPALSSLCKSVPALP